MTAVRTSTWFRLAWYLPAGAMLVLVPVLKYADLWWRLPRPEKPALLVVVGILAIACLATLFEKRDRMWSAAWRALLRSLAVLGLGLFAYALIRRSLPAYLLLPLFLCIAIIIPLSVSPLSRSRWLLAGWAALAVAAAAGAALHLRKQPSSEQVTKTAFLRSAFYALQTTSREGWIAPPETRGGALDYLGDQVILATGDGTLYLVDVPAGDANPTFTKLATRVPNNREEFAKAFGGSSRQPSTSSGFREAGAPRVQTWRFRVADLIARTENGRVQLFASHHNFNAADNCFDVQVSKLDVPAGDFPSALAQAQWETIYEAEPCIPMAGAERKRGKNPFRGEEIGGRLGLLDANTLLLTLGDFGFSGTESLQAFSQDPNAAYGKTIRIDLAGGAASVFTMGHRNPQGLYITREGEIWETEHGAQGGDELNLLEQGTNYGWPIVTYGTDYGSLVWPVSRAQGRHTGFKEPRYSWLPSIGVSQVIRIERDSPFSIWKGNLIVGSLSTRSLYRVVTDAGRVVLTEPIALDKRVRDILELHDGRLLVWTDDAALVTIEPAKGTDGEMLFATQCSGCHSIVDGLSHRLGPDLYGVVGRTVAGAPGFDEYSAALKGQRGEWTAERLDAFLRDPQGAVPGNAMGFAGMPDAEQRKSVIRYLQQHGKK